MTTADRTKLDDIVKCDSECAAMPHRKNQERPEVR